MILLATFGSLRWGELAALRQHNLDLDARTVRIENSVSEMKTGELVTQRPRTDAEYAPSLCQRSSWALTPVD
ncbi:hypothetical protein [Nonomuraea soli]|uniref:Integrase n=1 Tax=Nonomuraea soli TaxID=1032476 RepID=A0A7W0CTP0_9ACTN|nr:hypothetical protein [Nonomuraea soli]MBA2896945.1 integrase [Nonomuraea soli]